MIHNRYQLNFELRHLRSFMTIAEQLSFRKAAEILHIAQPALSKQIAHLEEVLGFALFDRSRRQIQLTEAGRTFYEKVPQIFSLLHDVVDRSSKIAAGKSASLKFGYSSAAMSSFLPAIVRDLQNQLDDCDFNFVESTSDELIAKVIAKQLDAAFILHRPKNPLLTTIPIASDPTGVILPSDHPLTKKSAISLADLKNETLILFPRHTNPSMYDEIIYHCQQAGFSPKHIIETAPRSTAIGHVAAGQGVASISASLKNTCVNGTTYRPLKQPSPMIRYSFIHLKKHDGNWLKLIKDYIADHLFEE